MSSLGVTVQTRTASPPKGISVDTGTAFMCCKAATGSTSEATLITSVTEYETSFGLRSVSANAPGYDWLDTFFREGGQRCYVARYGTSPTLASALALFGAELGPGQLACPEETPGTASQTVMIAHAKTLNRVALFDVGNGDSVSAMVALGAGVPGTDTEYGALFGPWVTVPAPAGVVGGSERTIPASAAIAALCARVDKFGNPNRAAAGRDYPLQYATGFVTPLTKANLVSLLDSGCNGGAEIFGVLENYGFQTAVEQGADNPYWQFNCSRTRMYIAAKSAALGEPFVFRPIDGRQRLQAALKGALDGMLLGLYQMDGLFGETPAEAFSVTVGAAVNTIDTIAQGELHAVAEVRYSMHAKAVIIDLVTVPLSQEPRRGVGEHTMYIRSDMADIRVSVNGVPYGDSWAEAEGGNLSADIAKVRPGGMLDEVSAGGHPTRDDLTVRIPFSDLVAIWHSTFESGVGNDDVVVTFHWLGRNKVPIGTSTTRKGTSQGANLPTVGSGSGDVGLYELVVSCDQAAT